MLSPRIRVGGDEIMGHNVLISCSRVRSQGVRQLGVPLLVRFLPSKNSGRDL